MKEYKIRCNSIMWNVNAGSLESAVRKIVVAERNRLKERSKEINKKLFLRKLEIYWEKGK